MKNLFKPLLLLILLSFSLTSQAVEKGELQLFTFKSGLPTSGVQVYLKNQLLGETNSNGSLLVELPVGKQKIQLRKAGQPLTELTLNVGKDEEIELLIPITEQAKITNIITESNQHETLEEVEVEDKTKLAKAPQKNAPKAILEGIVTSLQTKEGVPNVNIYIVGISQKIVTDSKGNFKVKIPAGEYAISFVHNNYSSQTIKDIQLLKNTKTTQKVELTPAAEQLEDFIVTAPALEGGVLAMMEQRRKSSSVTEVLSSEEMSNAGDSSVGDALKRVTGITYVGGKYVYVRGMGDRYSLTLLNNASLPSPEPSKKVVPLDLFPTAMIGSITVQKSYSPDIPADFGGGAVLLKTKTIPEERKSKISFALGGNTQSTGKTGLGYQGGSTDFLGFDDGTRALPEDVKNFLTNPPGRFDNNKEAITANAGQKLNSLYKATEKTLLPDASFKVNTADIREIYGKNWSWGYNFSFGYSRKSRLRTEYGEDNLIFDPEINSTDNKKEKTRTGTDTSAMLNLMIEIGDYDSFDSTTIISRKTVDTVTLAQKYESESTSNYKDFTFVWEERQLLTQQFHGKHIFPNAEDLELEWQTTFSNAQRQAPDSRFYQYGQSADISSGAPDPYQFTTVGTSNSRVWEELSDNQLSLSFDLRKPLYDFLNATGSWDNGVAIDSKDRTSDVYRTRWSIPNNTTADLSNPNPEAFLNSQYISGDSESITLQNYTTPTDSYKAKQQISAFYTKLTTKWENGFSVMAGIRSESSLQEITTITSQQTGEVTKNTLDENFILPSLNLSYAISPALGQIRLAYAQSVNRPDLRELSEARYFNPEDDRYYVGNPQLEIAQISHYDLRWEKYMSSFESVSVAFFLKEFTNPIELTQEPGGGTIDSFTYNNVAGAVNQGVELQGRIWLRRLLGNTFNAFYFDTNATFIQSEIDLSNAPNYIGTNKKRALQGQSPWVFNANLGYKNLVKEIKANLVLNMKGDLISEVGVNGEDDTFLESPMSLNFVYKQRLHQGPYHKWGLKTKVSNLLDGELREVVGEGGTTIKKRYKTGVSFNVEVNYSWK